MLYVFVCSFVCFNFFFFFQAEDGIRDSSVTGVQTCALPILFGLLALGLASIGLYGILAYAATRRQHEIGLRMALGASRLSVLRLILGEGMSLVLVGLGVGFVASLATGRVLSRALYGVSGTDPLSIAAAAVVLSAVAL